MSALLTQVDALGCVSVCVCVCGLLLASELLRRSPTLTTPLLLQSSSSTSTAISSFTSDDINSNDAPAAHTFIPASTAGQSEHAPSPSRTKEKNTSCRNDCDKLSSIAPHSRSSGVSSSEDEEPSLAPPLLAPCEAGPVEASTTVQVPEFEERRSIFQKVFFLLRKLNNLVVLESESSSTFTVFWAEELWSGTTTSSPPTQLLMSKMMSWMLLLVKFEVPSEANLLAARRLSLLPPLSYKNLRHWYKLLDDKDMFSARRISPEFADFVGRNLDVVASVSIAFSASEFVFSDTALNILRALPWLDHGLVATAKMLSQEVDKDLKELILLLAKSLQFLCNNEVLAKSLQFLCNNEGPPLGLAPS